jgi:hypothetical protein
MSDKKGREWKEEELAARGKGIFSFKVGGEPTKDHVPSQAPAISLQPPPATSNDPDEKLDRVDRFLMFKSRIV